MADKEELKKTSVPGEKTAEKPKKKTSYISAKESRRITKFNRKITKKLEHDREEAGKDPAYYTTKMRDPNNVVEFDNMCTYFFSDVGTVKAVDGISFDVPKCSTVGVVGESGCGKSVTSLSLMQLLQRPSGQTVGGEIRLNMGDGTALNIVNTPVEKMQELRGNSISMIFQEPMTALNPVFRIGRQVNEVIELHNPEMTEEQVKARTMEMLELVGIANKEGVYEMYPHELSGGMRQRVCIAIALACRPGLIIADEPTTALDVTIQYQIMELLRSLRDETGMSILLITHDIGVVAEMADRVTVMYAGQCVESAPAETLLSRPAHAYTRALMQAVPGLRDDRSRRLYSIPGHVPEEYGDMAGCRFAPRCPHGEECPYRDQADFISLSPDHLCRCRWTEGGREA